MTKNRTSWGKRNPTRQSPAAVKTGKLMAQKSVIMTEVFKGIAPEGWLTDILKVRQGYSLEEEPPMPLSRTSVKAGITDLLGALYKDDLVDFKPVIPVIPRRLFYCCIHKPNPRRDNLNKKNRRKCVRKGCDLVATKIDVSPHD